MTIYYVCSNCFMPVGAENRKCPNCKNDTFYVSDIIPDRKENNSNIEVTNQEVLRDLKNYKRSYFHGQEN